MAQPMKLMEHPDWPLGASGGALFVSFRGTEQDVLGPLEDAPALGALWQKNVCDLRLKGYGADGTLQGSQVAFDLLRRIQRSRRDRYPLDWIAFLGVESLRANLPAVSEEWNFWSTILSITNSARITTAFVVTTEGERTSEFVERHRQDMDYVFDFSTRKQKQRVKIAKAPDDAFGRVLELKDGALVEVP